MDATFWALQQSYRLVQTMNVAPLQGERHGFAVLVVSQLLPQFMLACHLLITLRLNSVLLFIAGAGHHGPAGAFAQKLTVWVVTG